MRADKERQKVDLCELEFGSGILLFPGVLYAFVFEKL